MFATAADVATRLGRELTDSEESQATAALEEVANLILSVVGLREAPDLVPGYFKSLSITKVAALVNNPEGVAARSEQLGSYSESTTYQRANDGLSLLLTSAEERRVRRVYTAEYGLYSVTLATPYSGPAEDDNELPLDESWGS